MSAGTPNYQKLHEMGKLPKDQRHKIPGLAELDNMESFIEKVKTEVCQSCHKKLFPDDQIEVSNVETQEVDVSIKCEVEGCSYTVSAKSEALANNRLRMHSKSHLAKK